MFYGWLLLSIFSVQYVKLEHLNEDKITLSSENEASRLYNEALQIENEIKFNKRYIQLMSKAAKLGSNDAKLKLVDQYLFGKIVPINFTTAFQLLNEIVNSTETYSPAYSLLAFMYSNGLGVKSSQYKALVYYSFAAEANVNSAKMALAYRYLKGINVVGNCEQALFHYSRVADEVASSIKMNSGSAIVKLRLYEQPAKGYKLGMIIEDEVIQYYQLLAERGDLQAQLGLGELFYSGKRVTTTNFKRALYYFNKAAAAGSVTAVSYMGRIYVEGDSEVPQNTGKALRLLRHASEKGDAIGQSGLGLMYYHGIGVKKDFALALKYFTLAAEQKNIEAFLWLGIMNFNGDGMDKNLRRAIEYFTLATQNGHVLGPYYLATINSYGPSIIRQCETSADKMFNRKIINNCFDNSKLFKTVSERGMLISLFLSAQKEYKRKRYNEAFMMYLFLSECGYEEAEVNAAYLLDQGLITLFDADDTKRHAFSLYQKSANQGNSFARVRLGDFYYYGFLNERDYAAAISQYKVAADKSDDPQAMFNIGYMYQHGLGLKQDIHLAKRFYDKAKIASADAHLPTSLALFKLKFAFLHEQINQLYPVKRSITFIQEMRALRIGTMLSGLLIFVIIFWQRPV